MKRVRGSSKVAGEGLVIEKVRGCDGSLCWVWMLVPKETHLLVTSCWHFGQRAVSLRGFNYAREVMFPMKSWLRLRLRERDITRGQGVLTA